MARKAKNIKVTACHDIIFNEFKKFEDPRAIFSIKLTDILMASLSVFSLKCPSLLNFEKYFSQGKRMSENIMTLFRLEKIPSDTQLREVLDKVDYLQYRQIFKNLFSYLQRAKTLEFFEFMKINNNPYYLIAADGSGYFRSEKIRCDDCLVSEHFDAEGRMSIKYGHNMLAASVVHPDRREVISLYPEAIVRQDGNSKNDSEQASFKRFLNNFNEDHPKLKVIFILDALYANGPIIRLLREYKYEFIIAVKDSKSLLYMLVDDGLKSGETKLCERQYQHGEKVIKTTKLNFKYRNNIRLHQDKDTPYINFAEVIEFTSWVDSKGKEQTKKQRFSFITDIKITNNNVEKLCTGGRTRWKIENETFNTLKNRGYHFEHNYGHGEKNLSYNFIMSMFLAFLVDQIQEISCLSFRKLVKYLSTRSSIWEKLKGCLELEKIADWDDFYKRIIDDIEEHRGLNTS